MESIYGLYSDLMKVGEFVGGTSAQRRPPPSHHHQMHHQPMNATRMGWDLTGMAVSDESVVTAMTEATSNGAIYQEGMSSNAGRLSAQGVRTRMNSQLTAGMSADGTISTNPTTGGSDSSNSDGKVGIAGGQLEEVSTMPSGASQAANGYGDVRISSNNPYGEFVSRPLSRRSGGSQGVSVSGPPVTGVIQRRDTVYSESPINGAVSPSTSSPNKTALLITGGNGYKRATHDNQFASQHAHCIIWEYKL
jgi:hypothetical protein